MIIKGRRACVTTKDGRWDGVLAFGTQERKEDVWLKGTINVRKFARDGGV